MHRCLRVVAGVPAEFEAEFGGGTSTVRLPRHTCPDKQRTRIWQLITKFHRQFAAGREDGRASPERWRLWQSLQRRPRVFRSTVVPADSFSQPGLRIQIIRAAMSPTVLLVKVSQRGLKCRKSTGNQWFQGDLPDCGRPQPERRRISLRSSGPSRLSSGHNAGSARTSVVDFHCPSNRIFS